MCVCVPVQLHSADGAGRGPRSDRILETYMARSKRASPCGTACLGLASAVRARPRELLMRLSLGSAFILWGIQQLMHDRPMSVLLGDMVIVLFVVDRSAIIGTMLRIRIPAPADGSD